MNNTAVNAVIAGLLACTSGLASAGILACAPYTGPAMSSLNHYEGLTHEHSAYSDGDPHFIPDDYFRIAKQNGYSFVASSEHSDSLDDGNFATLHASCDPSTGSFDPFALEYCFLNPSADKLTKWNATLSQAQTRSSSSFEAIRGFEWTSDIFGHINVYFSKNFTNAKSDLGYALTMQTFWDWFTRDPNTPGDAGAASSPVPYGGGGDGLAHFNHPHDKCTTKSDPSGSTVGFCDWNDYTLIPAAVERMFGIEAYNDSNRNDRYQPYLTRALDKGWRLSFLGSEDEHFAKYAVETSPKTVTIAADTSDASFKAAWLARRTYALSPGRHLRVAFNADGHPMGSQLQCAAGRTVPMSVAVSNKDGTPFAGSMRLFTNGGVELARMAGTNGSFQVPVLPGRHWYFVRVHDSAGVSAAYVAPVWIDGSAPVGSWLGGDMHVHTDHSADGSAPRQSNGDKAPGNVSITDQIGEAEREGVNWMPLTDHRTYDQHYDPLWESSKLLLIPGEEGNGSPHVTIHGAVDMIDQADAPGGSPEFRSVQQSVWSAHAQGAAFAIAHPDDGELNADGTPNNRANVVGMDSMEAWNRGSAVEAEMDYAENRWNHGFRFGINGGSDDHFRELWGASSPGTPRTQVFASANSERGILDAMKAGRFMLQLRSTDPFATLEGDFQKDGVYEALQGDEAFVPAGTPGRLRVHVIHGAGNTVYLYQAPGRSQPAVQTWMPTADDQTFTFDITAPASPSWYRVEVRGAGENAGIDTNALKAMDFATILAQNRTVAGNQRRAVTSPIFISPAPVVAQGEVPVPADAGSNDAAEQAIGDLAAFAGFPAVAESAYGVHVVSETHSPGSTEVMYRRRLLDGSWDAPFLLSDGSPAARFPKVAAVGSNVWVVWEDERGGQIPRRKAIYMRQSIDGGVSWLPQMPLRVVVGRAEHPVIAATPDGHAVVAWAEIQAGKPFDVWAQVLGVDGAPLNVSGTGKTFGAATPLDTRSAIFPASVWPALATAPNGSIALAWQDDRSDTDPLFTGSATAGKGTAPDNWQIMVSTRSGALWVAPISLGANDRADRHPAVAYAADGKLAVAWDTKALSAAGPNLTVLAAVSSNGGQSFASPVLLGGNASAFGQRPALARATDGGVRIAWFDNRSADWRWRIAQSQLLDSGSWSDVSVLPGKGINTWPAVAGGSLVFASTRNATRLQRDLTQQIFVISTPAVSSVAPSPFNFIERDNVPVNSFVTSEAVTLSGFTGLLSISISDGGQYRIGNGAFTNSPGQIAAGSTLTVRHVSANTEKTARTSVVTVGSYSTNFVSVTTAFDRVPDAFDFGRQDNQQPSALIESNAIILTGFNTNIPVVAGPGVEYRIGNGPWTRANGLLGNASGDTIAAQTLQVRHTSNSAHLGYTKTYLKVGGVTGYFLTRSK